MPLLFFGTIGKHKKPRLYSADLVPLESHVFDHFMGLGKLTPKKELRHVGRRWHIPAWNHTALSWIDSAGSEQTVFMPSLLSEAHAIHIARDTWPSVLPSPITLRFGRTAWQIK